MLNKDVTSALSEKLLRQAVIECFERELAAIPPDEELEKMYTFSAQFEAKMKKMIEQEMRKSRVKAALRNAKKTAASILIIIGLLFGTLMLVPEVRAQVVEVIIQWFDKYTSFQFQDDNDNTENLTFQEWQPGYIPEGFRKSETFGSWPVVATIYTNDDNVEIIFKQIISEEVSSLDNEKSDMEIIFLDGYEAYAFASDSPESENMIMWEQDDNIFRLQSFISLDELINMAESVAPVE